ncbi:MAG: protein IQM2-like [Chlamydiia bacterium]|nr:protein IQM2-like [Chlamydiia bacterium]
MKRLSHIVFSIGIFLSVQTVFASPISQEITSAVKQKRYLVLSGLLKKDLSKGPDLFIPGKSGQGQQLLTLLIAIIEHTNWQEDMQLFTYADKIVRLLDMQKLKSPIHRKFTAIVKKMQAAVRSNHSLPIMMNLEYSVEIVSIPKSAISIRSNRRDRTRVHVYRAIADRLYRKWKASSSKIDFQKYIAKHTSPEEKRKLQSNTVLYLTPSAASTYIVTFQNGKAMQSGSIIPDGRYMYVIDATGANLYVGKKVVGSFHHSSFVSGAPVQSAGRLYIKDGIIYEADMTSGHYKPTIRNGRRLLTYLSDPSRMGNQAINIDIHR